MHARDATPEDYEIFSRFFRELAVPEPTPAPAWWERFCGSAFFLEQDGAAVGYALCFMLEEVGNVMHVVVAEHARAKGVGRRVMDEAGRRLHAQGARRWGLFVKDDNQPAIRLYRGCGMEVAHPTLSLQLPWSALDELPRASLTIEPIAPEEDASLERTFDVPRGRLARDRSQPGWVLAKALAPIDRRDGRDGRDRPEVCGLVSFDPSTGVAPRFRARDLATLRALFGSLERREDTFRVNVDGRPDLVEALRGRGATTAMSLLRMEGPLVR